MRLIRKSALVVAAVAAGAASTTVAASAAPSYDGNPAGFGQSVQSLQCTGLGDLMIRTNSDNSSEMGGWSAAKIVSGGTGTLIPTSFTFAAYDDTQGAYLFPPGSQLKGGGSANHQQGPVDSCVQSMTGTLADFLEPGEEPPPGASVDDIVTVTFTVTAIHVG